MVLRGRVQVMLDRHPVEYVNDIAGKLLPRLASIG
jgi:hypothetical protein